MPFYYYKYKYLLQRANIDYGYQIRYVILNMPNTTI